MQKTPTQPLLVQTNFLSIVSCHVDFQNVGISFQMQVPIISYS